VVEAVGTDGVVVGATLGLRTPHPLELSIAILLKIIIKFLFIINFLEFINVI
jgi:hypothetical protein